jgi:hypothetical protein
MIKSKQGYLVVEQVGKADDVPVLLPKGRLLFNNFREISEEIKKKVLEEFDRAKANKTPYRNDLR